MQLSATGLRRLLVILCVMQIVSWCVLHNALPLLAPSVAADTGWSVAAFSAGLVVSALVGIPAGRLLDRHG